MKSQDLISSDTFSLKGIYKKIVLLTKDEFWKKKIKLTEGFFLFKYK